MFGIDPRHALVPGRVRVQGQEVPRVPQRQHGLAHRVADAALGHHEVAAAQDRRGHQEPPHGVRAVAVEHLVDVRVVLARLGHLLPVVAQHDPVRQHVGERGPVEQRRGQHVHRVEPAARLAVVLDDEVAGEVVVEPLGVLERVVDLGERHRAGLEPAVQHLGHPAHRGLPGRVVRVRAGQQVDVRAVQVRRAGAEVALQLVERAVHVDARELGVVRHPHGQRGTPEPVARDVPVARVLQPLAELAVLDVLGHPVDLLVDLDHPVLELRDRDEPRRHRALDQRAVAAPAVRVRVVVGLVAQQQTRGLEVADDRLVRLEDVHAPVGRDLLGELAARVHRDDDLDARGVGDDLVLLTEGGGDVHDARAVLGGDVVRRQHLVGVLAAQEEVERRRVLAADQVGALDPRHHRRLLAQLAGVRGHAGLGEQVALARNDTRLDDHIIHVRVHGRGQVARQRPRGRRPDQRQLTGLQAQADGHGRVLPVAVDVVHLGLGVGQGRLAPPAVPEHPEALVDQTLVVQGLEGPHDAFHVVQVEGLVVVVEVDPPGLARHVVAPLVGVLEHGLAARVVELGDAHRLDLALVRDPQLLLGLDLGGHAVRVPAEPALDVLAAHGLVARDDVLGVAGQQVPVVREAVRERRPFANGGPS